MGHDNLGNYFVGTDIPSWMKKRSTVKQQLRSQRQKQIIDRNNKYTLGKLGRPPMTQEQIKAGARRIDTW